MWKLLLLAAVICAVGARPDMEAFQANLTALWQQVHEMRQSGSCRPEVRITLDAHGDMGGPPGRGGRHGRGPPGSYEDEDMDMEMEEGEGESSEGHRRGHGHGHEEGDVHVHLHVGKGEAVRPAQTLHMIPWLPPHMAHLHTHARCHMVGDIQGSIDMRQEIGGSPLEMEFHLTGFPTDMAEHPHALSVHWASVEGDDCSTIGRVFQPPHPGLVGGRRRPHDDEEHERYHPDREAEASRARRSHHDHHDHHAPGEGGRPEAADRVEGDLGTVSCDVDGNLEGHHEFRWSSIVGMHSIAGRSIAIHASNDIESDVIGCGNINFVNGAYWNEADEWAPRGETGRLRH